jgi:lysophospholipase
VPVKSADVAWGEVLRPGVRAFRAHKAMSDKVGESKYNGANSQNDPPQLLTTRFALIATLRIFPGISGSAVRAFLQADDVKGVVLESFGAGNAPRKEELLSAFREAADRGVVSLAWHRSCCEVVELTLGRSQVIVNVSQCTTGAVAPDIYETGRALAAVGIIGGADMTVEVRPPLRLLSL